MDLDFLIKDEDLSLTGTGRFAEPPPVKSVTPAQPAQAAPPASDTPLADGFYCDVPNCKHTRDPFLTRDALLAHKAEAHRPKLPPPPRAISVHPGFYCQVSGCKKFGKRFPTQHALDTHTAAVHPPPAPAPAPVAFIMPTPPPAPAPEPIPHTPETVVGKHTCPECPGRTFTTRQGLVLHQMRAHGALRGSPGLLVHDAPEKGADGLRQCPHCTWKTKAANRMARHIEREHAATPPIPAAPAHEPARSKTNWRMKGSYYVCPVPGCPYDTKNPKAIPGHMKSHHAEERLAARVAGPMPRTAPPEADPDSTHFCRATGGLSGTMMICGTKGQALENAGRALDMGFTKVEIGVIEYEHNS